MRTCSLWKWYPWILTGESFDDIRALADLIHIVKIPNIGLPEAPAAPSFVQRAVLGLHVLTPWVLAYPKLVCSGAWACFDPIEPDSCSLIGCAFCLDLWSVFPCSWSVFSPLFHLHTTIYQHSWKWSVINPYHYVDAHILCIYAGVDGLDLILKSRQQLPHT